MTAGADRQNGMTRSSTAINTTARTKEKFDAGPISAFFTLVLAVTIDLVAVERGRLKRFSLLCEGGFGLSPGTNPREVITITYRSNPVSVCCFIVSPDFLRPDPVPF